MARLCRPSWASSVWESGWVVHSARTAIGTTASLAVARLLGMPEAYWAPITTLIVLQSTLGAAWEASKPRFIGTALGALLAGLLATYVGAGMIVFGGAFSPSPRMPLPSVIIIRMTTGVLLETRES